MQFLRKILNSDRHYFNYFCNISIIIISLVHYIFFFTGCLNSFLARLLVSVGGAGAIFHCCVWLMPKFFLTEDCWLTEADKKTLEARWTQYFSDL